MALMKKCFCCGLRNGSILSAIYCMVFSAISVALSAYYVYMYRTLGSGSDNSVFIINAIELLLFITILIVSIILLFAVFRDSHKCYIPFIIVMLIFVVVQAISLIILIVMVVSSGFEGMGFFYILYNIFCLVINILCIVCVTSYYQETRDSYDATVPAATNYA